MFKKILVANDGSEGARKALQVAIDLAVKYGADLYSISIEEDLPKYAASVGEVVERKEEMNGYFDKVNAEAAALAKVSGVSLHTHIAPGHEVETIIDYVKENRFDLLVIGFMGHSRVYEKVWGSTSQNLTRLSPCSVVIVK
jgi:nucleotide-binding universal stress UspA family protein